MHEMYMVNVSMFSVEYTAGPSQRYTTLQYDCVSGGQEAHTDSTD